MNTETLHIVLSDAGRGLLREALRLGGEKGRVVSFPDYLAHGPIDPPAPATRLRWMINELGFAWDEWDWLPRSVARFWRLATEPAERRIVWTSSRSANEHSAFLAWIERMGDQRYEVIDLANLEVTWRFDDGQTRRDPARMLGMLAPRVIAAEALWEHARALASNERQVYAETWRKLRQENAALRIIGPDGLRSAPITCFDKGLLSQASQRWQRVSRVIAGVLMADGEFFQAGGHVLAARLHALIAAGELECRLPPADAPYLVGDRYGLTPLHADAEVRLSKS